MSSWPQKASAAGPSAPAAPHGMSPEWWSEATPGKRRRRGNAFGIVYPPLLILPPYVAGDWFVGRVIAWAVISAAVAGLVALTIGAFVDESAETRRSRPADPPEDDRPSWRAIFLIVVAINAIGIVPLTLANMWEEGLTFFLEPATWTTYAVVATLTVVVLIPLMRWGLVTKVGIRRQVAARRGKRAGRPRDLALLGGATNAQLIAIRRRVVRREQWSSVVLLLSFGGCLVLAFSGNNVLAWVFALGLLLLLLEGGVGPDSARGDPVLLVGRITGGVHGVSIAAGSKPTMRALLFDFVQYRAWRKITVEVSHACWIERSGSLHAAPEWLRHGRVLIGGTQTLGAHRLLHTRAIEGERCVMVCTRRGAVVGLFSDLIPDGPA